MDAASVELVLASSGGGLDDQARRALAVAVAGGLVEARTAWPRIQLSLETFLADICGSVKSLGDLADLRWPDLYLAQACAHGDRWAVEAFDATVLERVRPRIRQIVHSDEQTDELMQRMRIRLLVGDDAGPRIREYAGRGSLLNWARVTGARAALDHLQAEGRRRAVDKRSTSIAVVGDDPEFVYLRAQYGRAFAQALESALASLTAQQRNVLRYYLVGRIHVGDIAALYQVHRATMARWIADIRAALLERTRDWLKQNLTLESSDIDSILRMLRSSLAINVRDLLDPDRGAG